MRKGILILALALASLMAFNITTFMAFTSDPSAVNNPLLGIPRKSFNFDIRAASSLVRAWVLKGLTKYGWRTIKIWLIGAGNSIRLIWPEASFSVLNRARVLLNWPESILGIENKGLIILLSWVVLSTLAVSIWQLVKAGQRHRVETRKRRMRINATEPKPPSRN